MSLLSSIFGGNTKTTTTATTNASQTTNAVSDSGIMANNSNVTSYRDESVTTQLFDSRNQSTVITDARDMSTQLFDSRNQSVTYVDNSQDVSGDLVKEALAFADHNNALNAQLWASAMSETYSAGKSYAAMSGAAFEGANKSIMDMATMFANSTLAANANDGEALASSLEKFGKMGVVLILGVAVVAAFRGK